VSSACHAGRFLAILTCKIHSSRQQSARHTHKIAMANSLLSSPIFWSQRIIHSLLWPSASHTTTCYSLAPAVSLPCQHSDHQVSSPRHTSGVLAPPTIRFPHGIRSQRSLSASHIGGCHPLVTLALCSFRRHSGGPVSSTHYARFLLALPVRAMSGRHCRCTCPVDIPVAKRSSAYSASFLLAVPVRVILFPRRCCTRPADIPVTVCHLITCAG
jgi:hypothetical protein